MHSAQKSRTTELLQFLVLSTVAIAIVAVLFPVLNRAKESGDRVVAAKMDDLGRALAEYSQDNDGLLPSGSCPNKVTFLHSNTGVGWAGQVYLYDPNFRDFDDGLGQTLRDRRRGTIVSFAYNRNAARNSDEGSWSAASRTILLYQVIGSHAFIDVPNELGNETSADHSAAGDGTYVMLIDNLWPRYIWPGTGPVGGRSTDNYLGSWPSPELHGGSMYLMADGHVKWMPPSKVSSGFDALASDALQTGVATGHAAGTADASYDATFSTR